MLRYRADLRTLAFTAIYFSLVAVQWIYTPKQLWLAVPAYILTCWFSFFGAVATHNTVHCPVFKTRGMNRLFQLVLTLTYGHPVSAFVPGHNLSHHRYTQSRRDVMRTTKVRYRWNFLNGLLFIAHVAGDITKGDVRFFKAMFKKSPAWAWQMVAEFGVLYAAYGALLVLDWKKFLFYVFIPHKYAAWGIITMNLLQHDGADEHSEYNHSRNFVGKVVNFFAYNNGFHTIHHMEAGLHWSLAPAEHAKRVAPFIHPNLEQKSLIAYLWRTYFWPGKRLTYLGEPLVLPPLESDVEWIPGPKEAPSDVSFGAVA